MYFGLPEFSLSTLTFCFERNCFQGRHCSALNSWSQFWTIAERISLISFTRKPCSDVTRCYVFAAEHLLSLNRTLHRMGLSVSKYFISVIVITHDQHLSSLVVHSIESSKKPPHIVPIHTVLFGITLATVTCYGVSFCLLFYVALSNCAFSSSSSSSSSFGVTPHLGKACLLAQCSMSILTVFHWELPLSTIILFGYIYNKIMQKMHAIRLKQK